MGKVRDSTLYIHQRSSMRAMYGWKKGFLVLGVVAAIVLCLLQSGIDSKHDGLYIRYRMWSGADSYTWAKACDPQKKRHYCGVENRQCRGFSYETRRGAETWNFKEICSSRNTRPRLIRNQVMIPLCLEIQAPPVLHTYCINIQTVLLPIQLYIHSWYTILLLYTVVKVRNII